MAERGYSGTRGQQRYGIMTRLPTTDDINNLTDFENKGKEKESFVDHINNQLYSTIQSESRNELVNKTRCEKSPTDC